MTYTPPPIDLVLSNSPFYWRGTSQADHVCLLLHGLGGGVYEMQPIGHYLHEAGFSVAGINYPGHDLPAQWMPKSTWHQWIQHITQTFDELQKTHRHVSVIALSTGCPLSLFLSHTRPVHKMVLLSPFLKIKYQWFYFLPAEAYVHTVGPLVNVIPRRKLPIKDAVMGEKAKQAAFLKTFNLHAVKSALHLIETVKPIIPLIQQPALILQSEIDSVVCPSGARYIWENLGSAEKNLLWFNESDHILPLDNQRHEVFDAVYTFLSQTTEASIFIEEAETLSLAKSS